MNLFKTAYQANDDVAYEDLRATNMKEAKAQAREIWASAEPGTYEVTITGRKGVEIVERETITVTAR